MENKDGSYKPTISLIILGELFQVTVFRFSGYLKAKIKYILFLTKDEHCMFNIIAMTSGRKRSTFPHADQQSFISYKKSKTK